MVRGVVVAVILTLLGVMFLLEKGGSWPLKIVIVVVVGFVLEMVANPTELFVSYGRYSRKVQAANSAELVLPVHHDAAELLRRGEDEAAVELLRERFGMKPEGLLLTIDAARRIGGPRMRQEFVDLASHEPEIPWKSKAEWVLEHWPGDEVAAGQVPSTFRSA